MVTCTATDGLRQVEYGSHKHDLSSYSFFANYIKFFAIYFHCSTDTSSARTFSDRPRDSNMRATFSFPHTDRLLLNFFRFEEKPARTTVKNNFSSRSVKNDFEIFETRRIAESTDGDGEKLPRETFATIFGCPYTLTDIERILSLPCLPAGRRRAPRMRCATSFWTNSAIVYGCVSLERNWRMISPVM